MRKIFLACFAVFLLSVPAAFASGHHRLNGTWVLVPTDGNGPGAIRTARITINDREHNIYISRNFDYDQSGDSVSLNFMTDGREHATIREGKTFRSKAKWDGDVLRVTTESNQINEREQYSLRPDGTMMLVLERAGRPPLTLYFQRVSD